MLQASLSKVLSYKRLCVNKTMPTDSDTIKTTGYRFCVVLEGWIPPLDDYVKSTAKIYNDILWLYKPLGQM